MKRKTKKNKFYRQEKTTFDPKIHYRGKGQSGYGLRNDVTLDTSGAQIAHLLLTKETSPLKKK